MSGAGAKSTAESAELRRTQADRPESQQRRGFAAGEGYGMNCGKTAEEVRKPVLSPSLTPPTPAVSCEGDPECLALGAVVAPFLETAPARVENCRAKLAPQPSTLPAPGLCACEPEPGGPGAERGGAVVLTHPAFDRPPVFNERRRGLKKGTVSLAVVRRKLEWSQETARREALRSQPARDVLSEAMQQPNTGPKSLRGLVVAALESLADGLRKPGAVMDAPHTVREFCTLHLGHRDKEGFAVLFLDAQHALIEFAVMFEGTLSQTHVYPREVVRRALALNAGAVILAHNHPSGMPEPSRADEFLTQSLKSALALVDVRVLDHLVVGGTRCVSFAERGMI